MTDSQRLMTVLLDTVKSEDLNSVFAQMLGIEWFMHPDDHPGEDIIAPDGRLRENGAKQKRLFETTAGKQRVFACLSAGGEARRLFFRPVNSRDEFYDSDGNRYRIVEMCNDDSVRLLGLTLMGIPEVRTSAGIRQALVDSFDGSIDLMSYFVRYRPKRLSFILGAGVDYDYYPSSWNDLISLMNYRIWGDIVDSGNYVSFDGLLSLEGQLSNNNYVAPQILEDIDSDAYEKTLYEYLYYRYPLPRDVLTRHTTLYEIARIAVTQSDNTKVLTFNYDDLLERVIQENFGAAVVNTRYSVTRRRLPSSDVDIIHSHGYYPYVDNDYKSSEPHGIVLSTREYMENYEASGSTSRSLLNNQLRNSNLLIGNSLSDYEEQKAFYTGHRKRWSKFNFLLLRGDSKTWESWYKAFFFGQMGVLPLFFGSFDEMRRFLARL